MRIWATIRNGHRIQSDAIIETSHTKREQIDDWPALIGEACQALDLSRPVILKKHLKELHDFSRAVFKAEDFMEPVNFQRFEIEVLSDQSKKK